MQTPILTGADQQAVITIPASSIAPYIAAMTQPPARLSLDQIKEALASISYLVEQQIKQFFSWVDTMLASACPDLVALLSEER